MRYTTRIFLLTLLIGYFSCNKWDLEQNNFVQVHLLNGIATGLTTAAVSAEATDLQFGQIADHGFVWAIDTGEPTLSFNEGKVSLGVKEVGQDPGFSATISNLLPDTRYRLRAFAVVQDKEVYSEIKEIQTSTGDVSTDSFTYERGRSLEVTGHITGVEAGILATGHGFCWSTEVTEPTLENQFVDLGTQRSAAPFSAKIDELQYQVTTYIRAYANLVINGEVETFYGDVLPYTGQLKDIWEQRTGIPGLNTFSRHLFNVGEKVYTAFIDKVTIYDPLSKAVETKPFTGPDFINDPESYFYGFALAGKGYVLEIFSREVWQYDPGTDQWVQQASLPADEPLAHGLAFGFGDKAYFGSGYNYDDYLNGEPISGRNTWWEFDPSQKCSPSDLLPGCWTVLQTQDLSGRYDAVSLIIDNQVYLGLGESHQDWWAFNPSTQKFIRKKDFPSAAKTIAFTLNNRGYVLGVGNKLWEYIPQTDSWIEKSAILPRSWRTEPTKVATGTNFLLSGEFADLFSQSTYTYENWEYIPD